MERRSPSHTLTRRQALTGGAPVEGAQLVGDGGDTEGLTSGIGDGAGQGAAVGVEDVPGLAGLAGLDELVPDGDHDNAWGGAHAYPMQPEARQEGHMAGADARASLEDSRARLHVLGTAADIVAGRDGAVKQLADELGYGDLTNFSHAFKRWTGRSPSEYRRSQR